VLCGACGQENPEGFRFCGRCAAPLEQAAPTREVRKVVTIVFCDLTGSTALGDRTDPETLRATMRGYYDEMRAILERHGGTVEKFVGDAVMAVFGIPVSHEDDALRAVRAVWQMRSAVDALGLNARIGVNTGEVVTGGGETLVTGDAVNIAARLEQHAPAGEVLIGIETQRLVRGAVKTEPVELQVKGKASPIGAHRLLAVDLQAPAVVRRLDAPLIGRTRELGVLHQAYERAVSERACHLFTLLGSAGVGKSRLVSELLEGIDASVVRGRCLDYGEGITYWPVVEVLKQLGPRADATIELLDRGSLSTSELFWAVRARLEEAARERPLVVVFDDIHWGEPTFLDLLDHVADLSREAPILLVCVARAELIDTRPSWGGGKLNATTVLLEPLSAGDSATLIESLEGTLDPATRERILETAGGNPLFVEEMLALAREGGDIRVPSTIQALLQARLDQLGVGERSVIERGAVEGEVFHHGAIRELTQEEQRGDIDTHLVGLVRKELIRATRATLVENDAFRFRHLLVRDAAYDSLPKAVRSELHERFADWLAHQPVELVEQDEILGYHLEQAAHYRRELGNHDAAIEARAASRLAAAGSKALARDDMPAADNLLTRALALLPEDDTGRSPILLELLGVLQGTGAADRESRVIAELEASNDATARMRGRLSRFNFELRTAPKAIPGDARRAARDAIEMFEAAGDDAGLAHAWSLLFFVEWLCSRSEPALAAIDRALEHARLAGDALLFAQLFLYRSGPLMHGPFAAATVRSKLTEMQALTMSRPRLQQTSLFLEASLAAEAGHFDEARSCYQRADAILAELGMTMTRHMMRQHPAEFALREGHPAEAARIFRESYDGLGEVGETSFRSTVTTKLAHALYESGEPAEAERLAIEGETMGSADDVVNFAYGRSVRAMVLADRGELAEAEKLGRGAVDYAFETDFPEVHATAYLALAHVLRRAGRDDEARAYIEQAIEQYESRGDINSAGTARRLLETEL
jgi:class 3 adenylate cyclase/tetratricopeptide (TPR) repeat protein